MGEKHETKRLDSFNNRVFNDSKHMHKHVNIIKLQFP